jgi:hypothetical protein
MMDNPIEDRARRIGSDPRFEALLALATSYGMHGHDQDPVHTALEAQAAAMIYVGDEIKQFRELMANSVT